MQLPISKCGHTVLFVGQKYIFNCCGIVILDKNDLVDYLFVSINISIYIMNEKKTKNKYTSHANGLIMDIINTPKLNCKKENSEGFKNNSIKHGTG